MRGCEAEGGIAGTEAGEEPGGEEEGGEDTQCEGRGHLGAWGLKGRIWN